MEKKPNIIFIMTDQQRYDTFSKVNPEVITPNFDKLIDDSVFFENAYCSNPSCVPSRAGMMTGKYPSECGAPSYITPLPENETTFMTRLQEAGYYTAVIGKQHFAGSTIKKGYDYENIIDAHFAAVGNPEAKTYTDYLGGLGLKPEDVYKRTLISGGEWKTKEEYHLDYFIGELGKEWLNNRFDQMADPSSGKDLDISANEEDLKKPFFFTLSFPGPHHPYDCEGTKYADMYDLDKLSMPKTTYEDLDQKPGHFKEMGGYSKIYLKDFTAEQFLKTKRSYYANMTLIDEKVGQVIKILKDRGEYDNTLIIYSTDHGDFMGDFGMVEKLQCLTDSLMHVPLFVKPPVKDFKGYVSKDPVVNIDIASTCLTSAGADIPLELSNHPYNMYWDANIKKKIRDYVYLEARDIRGTVKDGIKVMNYIDRDYGELYDMNKDPLERDNLWDDPAYALQKLEGLKLIANHMYRATPEWNTPWNYGTPEI